MNASEYLMKNRSEIRRLRAHGFTVATIAQTMKCSQTFVRDVLRRNPRRVLFQARALFRLACEEERRRNENHVERKSRPSIHTDR